MIPRKLYGHPASSSVYIVSVRLGYCGLEIVKRAMKPAASDPDCTVSSLEKRYSFISITDIGDAQDGVLILNKCLTVNLRFSADQSASQYLSIAINSGIAVDLGVFVHPAITFLAQVVLAFDPSTKVTGNDIGKIDKRSDSVQGVTRKNYGFVCKFVLFHFHFLLDVFSFAVII